MTIFVIENSEKWQLKNLWIFLKQTITPPTDLLVSSPVSSLLRATVKSCVSYKPLFHPRQGNEIAPRLPNL